VLRGHSNRSLFMATLDNETQIWVYIVCNYWH